MPFKNYSLTKNGQLTIGQIFSPDFITGVSGWEIRKDGTAEFNDLVIRGTFNGTNFIINSAGAFFYSGIPAAGNLVLSAAQSSGSDKFGNAYKQGFTAYGPGTATSIWNDNGLYAGLVFHQTGSASLTVSPQAFAVTANTGAANEFTQATLTSGKESGKDDAAIQLFSQSADATIASKAVIEFGGTIGLIVTKTGPQYPSPPVYHADCTANLSVSASAADCVGANVTVTVHGNNSTAVVTGVFDMQTAATSGASVSGVLNWAGAIQTEDALIQTASAVANRATTTQTWVITGLTAGSYVAKLGGFGTTGGTIRGTHTGITVVVWEGL